MPSQAASSNTLNGRRNNGFSKSAAIAALVVAAISLLTLFVGTLQWGLKLEGELNEVRNDVTELQSQVGNGILPRAEERIEALSEELDEHKDDHE